jgi:hypothetical protein
LRSRARSPRMHHASYPVFVHRPAVSDWASFRPRLATTPLPFSLPSALRKPGHRTSTYEVTRHARRTRRNHRRCAALLRSVQRPKGVRSTAGLAVLKVGVSGIRDAPADDLPKRKVVLLNLKLLEGLVWITALARPIDDGPEIGPVRPIRVSDCVSKGAHGIVA